jgi:hypothetical protein
LLDLGFQRSELKDRLIEGFGVRFFNRQIEQDIAFFEFRGQLCKPSDLVGQFGPFL